MEWLRRIFIKSKQTQQNSYETSTLAHEVWEAHKDLKVAELKLNEAVNPDQIDYAIYITEAAEKRLNMLIREARERQLIISELEVSRLKAKNNTFDM
ncbi:MAG: DUF2508 family protein [Paenibacillaceae bacterium]